MIVDIINEFRKQKDDYFLKILKDTTVINIFKLNKKKKELEKGFDEVTSFYKWLEEREMIKLNLANIMLTKELESLAIEIRTMKERETAILEVLASWSAIVLSITALVISMISLNLR
jgi:hypothetical protein